MSRMGIGTPCPQASSGDEAPPRIDYNDMQRLVVMAADDKLSDLIRDRDSPRYPGRTYEGIRRVPATARCRVEGMIRCPLPPLAEVAGSVRKEHAHATV